MSTRLIRRYADLSLPAGQLIYGGQLVYGVTGPVTRTVTDGVTSLGSTTVTSATAAFQGADVGDMVSGAGIPSGAVIVLVSSASSVTLSSPATASASGVSLTFTVPTNPDWSSYYGWPEVPDVAYVAGANAANVIGVALNDAMPQTAIAYFDYGTTQPPATGFPAADRVVVGGHGEYQVNYAAATTIGQRLIAAANGWVTPFVDGTSTVDMKVGYALQTVTYLGTGLAYIGA